MQKFYKSIKILSATDVVVIGFSLFLTTMNFIFNKVIETWPLLVSLNLLLIIFVFWIAYYSGKKKSFLWENVHHYYVIPLIFLLFKEVYVLLDSIHNVDYDSLLISIDYLIFGLNPTQFLYQFANPALTELMQIAYSTFFFLPIILGVEFYIKKEFNKFYFVIFSVVLGFFLSYIGYFFLPAVGPRFTLHNFELTNIEIPGLFLTNFLREIINSGESIPSGTINPIEVVQRDVFPSGHTQMTLIVMYLSVKLKSSNKIFFLVDGTLLIIATVYLRYHYVIDVIGGIFFMIITMYFGLRLYNWWQIKTDREIFRY